MSSVAPEDGAELRSLPRSERVQRVFGFEPTDYQQDLVDYGESTQKAQAAPKAGRQVGKTVTAGVIGADYALTHKDTDVLYAAPAQATADEMFRECKQHFRDAPLSLEQFGIVKDNERTWEFDNGTRILARTLGNVDRKDNPGTRGMNPSCVIIDEAAYEKDDVYTQVIEEFFITHAEYEYYLFSTPAGQSGYFYHAVDGENADDWYSPHWPTRISPFAQQDFIEKKRDQLDHTTFAQEFLGEFVDEGEVYLPRSLVVPCVGDPNTNPSGGRWLGVDVARAGADETVYCGLDDDGHVFLLESEETSTMPGVVGRIKHFHEEYGFDSIRIDENAVGGGVVDFSEQDLGGVVQPVTFTTNTKQSMYRALKKAFEETDLTIPNHNALVHQLTTLQFDFTQHGKLRVSHPSGGHDDYPDALALANHARMNRSTIRRKRGSRPARGNVSR